MIDLKSIFLPELKNICRGLGESEYRANQLYRWIHVSLVRDFSEMTNLPASFRERLANDYTLTKLEEAAVKESALDGTKKFLFSLPDGNRIESVWMPYRDWNTACVSSQVGCAMGCAFCASGIDGCVRNMTAGEILEEVYAVQRCVGQRVTNVVVMGSGEPFQNYDEVLRFIRLLTDPEGHGMSVRSVTVSTSGIVPGIRALAGEGLAVNLAVSLHAPNDDIRRRIMPVAKRYPMEELLSECRKYFEATHRLVTFEYALIKDVNDSPEHAGELAERLKGLPCLVNLIPVNPVKELDFARPGRKRVVRFKNKLEKMGINGSIRRELGSDIDGACGQLRRSSRMVRL
ncbi:MAG: 23S rRNA (adenine(2503)-C(2))-methyltransferase RlmN [Lachnospiraceae bacterium]|nr:23S rRNA (adenine(2503)-C(2))-methyltransferase RlmN [Lachnospiraceae bacterium]